GSDAPAAWGWFLDPTPWDERAFTTPGHQGEPQRRDLRTVRAHESGHLLGRGQEAEGLMAPRPPASTRRVPHAASAGVDVAALDPVCADGKTGCAGPFAAESVLQVFRNGERQRQGEAKG